ncbi:MAG: hemolysin family protein [Oscillospiraceae bacterium]|nr:hemolysin family protein [Oscillospiraceae bacterium]
MDDGSTILLIILLIMVVLSAYFSATETAFTSLNRIRLKSRAENGDKRAARTLAMAEDYDRLLSTILIGNNIVNNVATTLSTLLFIRLLGSTSGPAVSTVVLTVVILIFGEVSPKSLAKESPEAFAAFSAPFLRLLMAVFRPLTFLFRQWKRLLSRLFHRHSEEGITDEELVTMVEEAEDQGSLDREESRLICSAIRFDSLKVGDILTPRVDVIAIEDCATMDEAAALFAAEGYSRMPVYHETLDNVVGVLHQKDLFSARYHGRTELSPLIHPVLHIAPSTKIDDLMRQFQKTKTHMAIVVDEYGGTEGILTLEDIVEELVGEIWDEHDEVIELFRKQEDGSYLISCSADLDDMYDLFSLTGEDDAATVSGWVMAQLGRVPEPGDHFVWETLDVTVTRVEHHRVMEIRVIRLPRETDDEL